VTLLAKAPRHPFATYTAIRKTTSLEVNVRADSTAYVLRSLYSGRVLLHVVLYDVCWYTGGRPRTLQTRKASA
jgi:hypothetical protein